MKTKIPTAAEVAAKRNAVNEEKAKAAFEQRKSEIMEFIHDKALVTIFTSALNVEAMDALLPTTHYNKELKMHGNKYLDLLTKVVNNQYLGLYKDNPEFTQNMTDQMEQVISKLSSIQFADYPLLNIMLDAFITDKDFWKDNLLIQFNRLDADLIEEAKTLDA
jgi:hypothetical protein